MSSAGRFEKQSTEIKKINAEGRGGSRPNAGRPRGVPNKISGDLKAMILDALSREGGVEYLQDVAQNDRKAFCSLLSRVLPMTLVGDKDNPVELKITWGPAN